MRLSVLAIGSELLDGMVIESNSNWIAGELLKEGLTLNQKLSVRDNREEILGALTYLAGRSDGIIITGGLGPTEDDKTRECAAEFTGKKLKLDPELIHFLEERFAAIKIPMVEENKKQAMVIEGSVIIQNPRGTAPGFVMPGSPFIAAFPGVPTELHEMFPDLIRFIKKNYSFKREYVSVFVKTVGLPESNLDAQCKQFKDPRITVGTIAHFGQVDVRLDIAVSDEAEAMAIAQKELSAFPEIKEAVFSFNRDDTIEKAVFDLLKEKKKKIMFAESCTGGLLSKLLTDISGSSAVFPGGMVTYANEIKQTLLGVKEETLAKWGAVSFETAVEMITGLNQIFPADYFLAVTGIAGPEGGSEEKPVGTVFIGLGIKLPDGKLRVQAGRFRFNGLREIIRQRTAMKAYEILWTAVKTGEIRFEHFHTRAMTNQEQIF